MALVGELDLMCIQVMSFLSVCLHTITLVESGAGDGGAKARARCEQELPLCSVAITTLPEVGSGFRLLEQKP